MRPDPSLLADDMTSPMWRSVTRFKGRDIGWGDNSCASKAVRNPKHRNPPPHMRNRALDATLTPWPTPLARWSPAPVR